MKLIDKVTKTIASFSLWNPNKKLKRIAVPFPPQKKKKNITSAKHLSSGHGQARFSMPLGTSIWYHRHPPWSWSTSERGMSLLKSLEDSVALKAIIESPLSHSLHLSYLRLLDERPPYATTDETGCDQPRQLMSLCICVCTASRVQICFKGANTATLPRSAGCSHFFQSNLDKVQVWTTPKALGKAKVHGNGVQVGKDPPTNAPCYKSFRRMYQLRVKKFREIQCDGIVWAMVW